MQKNQVSVSPSGKHVRLFHGGQWKQYLLDGLALDWKPVTELPDAAGWYAGALLPRDYDMNDKVSVNQWRALHGFTKVWYNPGGVWKFANTTADGKLTPLDLYDPAKVVADYDRTSEQVENMVITHWAPLPGVPLI